MTAAIDKHLIAASFSKAALAYDRHAELQRQAVDSLMARIKVRRPVRRILDLGSGTGYCSRRLQACFPEAELVNLDIAFGMLDFARRQAEAGDSHFVCADAEALPFADDSFDLVFSSLAIQWCSDYPALFREVCRVARPAAQCLFSTFDRQTLQELRQAWSRVDDGIHVNDFVPLAQLRNMLAALPLETLATEANTVYRYYHSIAELSRELKSIGAHNMNSGQSRGLTGKSKLSRLQEAFLGGDSGPGGKRVTWALLNLDFSIAAQVPGT